MLLSRVLLAGGSAGDLARGGVPGEPADCLGSGGKMLRVLAVHPVMEDEEGQPEDGEGVWRRWRLWKISR